MGRMGFRPGRILRVPNGVDSTTSVFKEIAIAGAKCVIPLILFSLEDLRRPKEVQP